MFLISVGDRVPSDALNYTQVPFLLSKIIAQYTQEKVSLITIISTNIRRVIGTSYLT